MKPEVEKIVRDMRAQGRLVSEIAVMLDKSEITVWRYMKELGLTKPADRTDISDANVIDLWNSGLTIVEIADKFKCSHDTITKRLAKAGISCDRVSGIKRHFERTHGDMWDDIKTDLDAGMSASAVSVKYHMRYQNVFRLMESKNYIYRSRQAFSMPEWDSRMHVAKNHVSGHSVKWDITEIQYLTAIRDYYSKYGSLPSVRLLAAFMDIDYYRVSAVVRAHGLDMFIDDMISCSAVVRLMNELKALGICYEVNNRSLLRADDGHAMEVDLYLPDFKLGLEINPTGTHSVDVGKFGVSDVGYHQRKSLAAEAAGIGLLHLYDDDIYDGRKYDILMGRLRGYVEQKVCIGARKCDVRSLASSVSNMFLSAYHFQGSENSASFRYGLYFGEELVSVLCVGRSRYTKHDFEIVRYCTRPDYAVSGGFNKLFHAFVSSCCADGSVVSYMDLNKRFSAENIYEKSGFVLDGITSPDYFWAKKYGLPVLRRYETTKDKLIVQGFDASKTEVEIMRERGFYRVFGAGSKRYVYNI